MKRLSIPAGIAALLAALVVGLVAEQRGSGGPAADRLLMQTASLSVVATPRSDSLRRGLNAATFFRRFVGIVDFGSADDSVTSQQATNDAAAPAPPPAAAATRGIVPAHTAAAPRPVADAARLARLAPAPQASQALADADAHTAIYDIAAHTLYLPGGEKLEAHSGIGRRLDDPRYVKAKNRGPTPPNVYELALRERRFHGVRALRLIPVGDADMFGRDGMLAHSYMLGPNGQSNGCVAVRNYPAFLHAYLSGQVDRLVVVDHLATHNRKLASLM